MYRQPASKTQHGMSLIISLMVLAVLTLAGMSVAGLSRVELRIAQNERTSQTAFDAAESGLNSILRSQAERQVHLNPFINGTDPVADLVTPTPITSPSGDWTATVEVKPLGASLPCPIDDVDSAGGSTSCVFYEVTSIGSVRTLAERGAERTLVGSAYVKVTDSDSGVAYTSN